MNVSQEIKMSKITEISDLLRQRENAIQKLNIGGVMTEYETYLATTPNAEKWILIQGMLEVAEIDDSVYDDFINNPSHYKIVSGEIVYNSKWEQEQAEKEAQRIKRLHMTKLDFYKYVLSPNGIDYERLLQVLNSNYELKAVWDLCANVYRGDDFLNTYIKQYIQITDAELDEIFINHGVEEIIEE